MKIISEGKTNSIEYDGKNFNSIKKMIDSSKFKISVKDSTFNKPAEINGNNLFKQDTVSIEKDGVYIINPSYQGNKKTKVS